MPQFWLVVLTSLWLATVCKLALWRELARLPELVTGQAISVGIALALVIATGTAALLSHAGMALDAQAGDRDFSARSGRRRVFHDGVRRGH